MSDIKEFVNKYVAKQTELRVARLEAQALELVKQGYKLEEIHVVEEAADWGQTAPRVRLKPEVALRRDISRDLCQAIYNANVRAGVNYDNNCHITSVIVSYGSSFGGEDSYISTFFLDKNTGMNYVVDTKFSELTEKPS